MTTVAKYVKLLRSWSQHILPDSLKEAIKKEERQDFGHDLWSSGGSDVCAEKRVAVEFSNG